MDIHQVIVVVRPEETSSGNGLTPRNKLDVINDDLMEPSIEYGGGFRFYVVNATQLKQ